MKVVALSESRKVVKGSLGCKGRDTGSGGVVVATVVEAEAVSMGGRSVFK